MRPIETIDEQFLQYARAKALAFGKEADWTRNELGADNENDSESLAPQSNDNNVWSLMEQADLQFRSKQWEKAKAPLEKLIELGVIYGERDGPLEQLATVYRELGDEAKEIATLTLLDQNDSDSLPTLSRLIDFSRSNHDWTAVLKYASKWIATQPLLPTGHEAVAEAASKLEHHEEAVKSLLA